jgi:hypothetical protein
MKPNQDRLMYSSFSIAFLVVPTHHTRTQVFEAQTHPGHVRIDTLLKALTTYGVDKLTEEQARELISQVSSSRQKEQPYTPYFPSL